MTPKSLDAIALRVAMARTALDSMDDFARMANIDPIGPLKVLTEFIDFVAELTKGQEPVAVVRLDQILNSGELKLEAVFSREGIGRVYNGTELYAAPPLPTIAEGEQDLNKCPNCGGPADNGHDRCYPPNPYYCKKCNAAPEYKQ